LAILNPTPRLPECESSARYLRPGPNAASPDLAEPLEDPPLHEVVARPGGAELRPARILQTPKENRGLPRGIFKDLVLGPAALLELRTRPEVGVAEQHLGEVFPTILDEIRRHVVYG